VGDLGSSDLRLIAAFWNGHLEDRTVDSYSRLAMLMVLYEWRRPDRVVFLSPGEEPPKTAWPPERDAVVETPGVIHVPSHDLHWTIENCAETFAELAAECRPGAALPWYVNDALLRPLLNELTVSYSAFRGWLRANKWPKPDFWEPLDGDADEAAPNARRGRSPATRMAVEAVLKIIYPPNGLTQDLLKNAAAKVNELLRNQGKPTVSEDTVSRALRRLEEQTQNPQK
jgi:hypothetical protein